MTIDTERKRVPNKNMEVTMDFGEKRIPRNNYSRTLVLDKKILKNCGCDISPDSEITAKVELVKNSKESFIKITPRCVTPAADVKASASTGTGKN